MNKGFCTAETLPASEAPPHLRDADHSGDRFTSRPLTEEERAELGIGVERLGDSTAETRLTSVSQIAAEE